MTDPTKMIDVRVVVSDTFRVPANTTEQELKELALTQWYNGEHGWPAVQIQRNPMAGLSTITVRFDVDGVFDVQWHPPTDEKIIARLLREAADSTEFDPTQVAVEHPKRLSEDWVNKSVSRGTHQPNDIMDAIDQFLPEELKRDYEVLDHEDRVTYLGEQVWQYMNQIAPKGTYFGAHPGNGSDFGFWECEEEV